MSKKHRYVGVLDKGLGFSLDTGPCDTICAAVQFTGDKRIVRRGTRYIQGEEPRNLAATASRMAKPWQSYYERTGKRYELELDAKRAKKEAKAKAERERTQRLRQVAPELRDMLKSLAKELRFATEWEPVRSLAAEMEARLTELDI